MEQQQNINIEKMEIPKGGGAYKGISNALNIELFTGAGTLQIPIFTSPCRGYDPKLMLNYSSSAGNGVFGMGFSVDLPVISRRTAKNIPLYDDSADTFIFAGTGELILHKTAMNDEGFTVSSYFLRNENSFSCIEYFKNTATSFWKITDRNNAVSFFGLDESSKILNTNKKSSVFSWLISETLDDKGNKIKYSYTEDKLIKAIMYGNYYNHLAQEDFAFSVLFHYEANRKDSFKRYNSGFLIETTVLCTKIAMVHNLDKIGEVVREMKFSYDLQSPLSLLKRVSVTGYTGIGDIAQSLNTPDLCFEYSEFDPSSKEYHVLQTENNLPFVLSKQSFSFVDLYGEGIAGLLYSDGKASLYSSPLGNFKYTAPVLLNEFPIHGNLSNPQFSLTSIAGNGKYELVVRSAAVSGFYSLENGKWGKFEEFKTVASEQLSPYAEEADLQGDRLKHTMISVKDEIRYYPSKKKDGFGSPAICDVPKGFPHNTQNSPTEVVCFLDLFGDGLEHRVRIKNGSVECFPNLGYGNFGDKIVLENPPFFSEGLDSSRLFFADIDGSGAADIIYAYPDRVDVYFNQGGKGFSKPLSVKLPENYTKHDAISFADINGTGTNCMIFSKIQQEVKHYCCDFSGGAKPYMLNKIDYNTGVHTELQYSTSTTLYLKDKQANVKWNNRPPFSIQLIVKKREIDDISKNILTTSYHYRDGLYDYENNEFIGFGEIETYETGKNAHSHNYTNDIRTKKWFYTGIDYTAEFASADTEALVMPDNKFDVTDKNNAEKSLWGSFIREEIFAGNEANPISVTQHNYSVTQLIAPINEKNGSFLVASRETISYHYEKDISDPIVTHTFALELDCYGNILKECSINYPRRKSRIAVSDLPKDLTEQQGAIHIQQTISRCINETCHSRFLGLPAETKTFDISGILCDKYFDFDTISSGLDFAMKEILPYGAEFNPGKTQARLSRWNRQIYWDDEQINPLSLGEIGKHALLYRTCEAMLPEKFSAINDKFDRCILESNCGYQLLDGYWWKTSPLTNYYDKTKFFLPHYQTHEKMFLKTVLEYDRYCLLPVKTTSHIDETTSNATTAVIDYTAMSYRQITDANDNVTQVLFDPLGQVIVATAYGMSNGKLEGNADISEYVLNEAAFEEVIAFPEKYVRDMSSYFYYDLLAYQKRKQPINCITLVKSDYKSDNAKGIVDCTITYWDGFACKSEEKHKVATNKWAVESRTIYSGHQQELLTYAPFYSDNPNYEYCEISTPPIRYYYDCLGRNIKTETPDIGIAGVDFAYLYCETKYLGWEQLTFDANSLLNQSQYYKEFIKSYPENPTVEQADKLDCLKKSLLFSGDSNRTIFDNRQNKIADRIDIGENNFTRYRYDSANRIIEIADARMRHECKFNFRYYYDMQGNPVRIDSCDSGTTYQIANIHGKTAVSINANNICKKIIYDGLMRPVETFVDGIGAVEKNIYGENISDCKSKNLCGQIYKHYDQAGIETNELYSFCYMPKKTSMQLCKEYTKSIDWNTQNEIVQEVFSADFEYNAAGKIISQTMPDSSRYNHQYDYMERLCNVKLYADGGEREIVHNIEYNADGKRAKIVYGNDVRTYYSYNYATTNLVNVKSTKQSGQIIQNFNYTYDSVGNLSRIRDCMSDTIIGNNKVTAPIFDYTYDKLYRLKSAVGRELAGHQNDFANMVAYNQEYSYDLGGNMLQIKHSSPAKTFTVDMGVPKDSNRINSVDEFERSSGGVCNINYDSCGNMIHLPNVHSLRWNYDNRLVHAVIIERDSSPNDEEYYVYASDGSRIRKVTKQVISDNSIKITEKIYLGEYCIKRVTTDTLDLHRTSMRISSGYSPMATVYNFIADKKGRESKIAEQQKIQFELENHLDCVSVMLNEKADIISFEEYYPFGGTALDFTNKSEVPIKEYRYCNKELDSATGLYYYNARYYSAAYGRMISPDDIQYVKLEDPQTFNLYAYCGNNPISHTDPTGNCKHYIIHGEGQDKAKYDARSIGGETTVTGIKETRMGKTKPRKERREIFRRVWARMESTADSTIVLFQHGSPEFIRNVDIKNLDTTKHASELVLFACNSATLPSVWGGEPYVDDRSFAQKFLESFPNIQSVIGTRGFHEGYAKSMGGGRLDAVSHEAIDRYYLDREWHIVPVTTPSFVMFTRGEGGVTRETVLEGRYESLAALRADARARRAAA